MKVKAVQSENQVSYEYGTATDLLSMVGSGNTSIICRLIIKI